MSRLHPTCLPFTPHLSLTCVRHALLKKSACETRNSVCFDRGTFWGTPAKLLLSSQKCQGVPFSPTCRICFLLQRPHQCRPHLSATNPCALSIYRSIYLSIYLCICIYIYIHMYIYIYMLCLFSLSLYIYIYIYTSYTIALTPRVRSRGTRVAFPPPTKELLDDKQ